MSNRQSCIISCTATVHLQNLYHAPPGTTLHLYYPLPAQPCTYRHHAPHLTNRGHIRGQLLNVDQRVFRLYQLKLYSYLQELVLQKKWDNSISISISPITVISEYGLLLRLGQFIVVHGSDGPAGRVGSSRVGSGRVGS